MDTTHEELTNSEQNHTKTEQHLDWQDPAQHPLQPLRSRCQKGVAVSLPRMGTIPATNLRCQPMKVTSDVCCRRQEFQVSNGTADQTPITPRKAPRL